MNPCFQQRTLITYLFRSEPAKDLSSDESEEDDNTTDEERKARQFRKRKAQPGWNAKDHVYKDPESGAQLYKDPNDGMTYEYDPEKRAWFPRINEDFVAQYQMNYGFTKDGQAEPTRPSEEPKLGNNQKS